MGNYWGLSWVVVDEVLVRGASIGFRNLLVGRLHYCLNSSLTKPWQRFRFEVLSSEFEMFSRIDPFNSSCDESAAHEATRDRSKIIELIKTTHHMKDNLKAPPNNIKQVAS